MTAKTIAIALVLAVLASACGDAGSETGSEELPPAAGACLAGDPGCQDLGPLPTGDEEPPLLPGEPAGGADPGVSAPLVGGGLGISEVLGADIDGGFAITGFYFEDDTGLRLCELLAESFPPQCGGAAIPFDDDAGVVDSDDLDSSQGVTWSNLPIVVVGEVVDGVFVATPVAE